MELLHFWTTKTSLTISIPFLWQEVITGLALSHDFLLRNILSLTALHKAFVLRKERGTSDADQQLLTLAAHHQNLALSPIRRALSKVTKENAPAILNFSSCNFMFTMGASRHFHTFYNYFSGKTPAGTPHWLKFIHGIRVLGDHWPWIEDSPLAALLPRRDLQTGVSPQTEEEKDVDVNLSGLSELWSSKDERETETLDANLAKLRHAFLFSSQLSRDMAKSPATLKATPEEFHQTFIASIIHWLHILDDTYIGMLDRKDTAALILFAHFAVLLSRLSDKWFIEGVPEEMVRAIHEQLKNKQHLLKWPMEQLKLAT